VLKRLLILEPNNAIWWRQLVDIELRAGNTKQALDALALADKQIALTAQERRLLASLYAHNGAPERAAITLEHIDQARSELELIVEQAKYWQTAKELETAEHLWLKAARLDGQYYWQYVLVLTYQDKWQQALQTIDKVQNPTTETALLKVQILYALERVDLALSMAKSALENTSDTQIENWVAFLEKVKLAREPSLMNKQKEGI
jgi:tetratricopeptide (TPR) repeat protein